MKPNDVLPEVRTLLRIALPAAGGQVAFAGLWTVDVLMLGAFGVDALNAAALGRLWLGGTLIFAFGLLLGNDPLIAQAHGAGDRRGLGRGLRRGFALALVLSIPLAAVWWLTGPALRFLGQDPGLSAAAHRYVAVQIPALPLALAFSALRQFQIARGVVHPSLWVAVAANVVNVAANAVLIFGVFGVPALGAVGAGLATAVTQVFMLAALLLWSRKASLLETGSIPWGRDALDLPGLRRIVALGWPMAVQLGLGTWIFQSTTVFAGWLGPTALAAQTVLLSLTGLVFMAPLGLSIAASTRIGHLIGAGDRRQAQRATAVALGTTVVLMAAAAAALTIFGGPLASAFTDDPAVLAAVLTVVPIVAAFQISDGVQAVAGGVLRAMGLTRRAAAVHLGAYYLVALPLAAFLAFGAGAGLAGLWWGLASGLTASALGLVLYLRRRGPATVPRLVDPGPSEGPAGDATGNAPRYPKAAPSPPRTTPAKARARTRTRPSAGPRTRSHESRGPHPRPSPTRSTRPRNARGRRIRLPERHYRALGVLQRRLRGTPIRWAVTGTSSLRLQGVALEPDDLDILTTRRDIYRLGKLFEDCVERPFSFCSAGTLRSHFGVLRIHGLRVEVMAEPEDLRSGRWRRGVQRGWEGFRREVAVGSMRVPVVALPFEARSYARLGEHDKVHLIRRTVTPPKT